MYFRIGILKNFAMFVLKHLCWSLFLINMQAWRPATLSKIDYNIGVFLWHLQKNTFFYRTNPVAASGNISWTLSLFHLRTMMVSFCGKYWITSAYFMLLRVFHFFLFLSFFLTFFVDSATFWFWEKFSILKIKQWSCS